MKEVENVHIQEEAKHEGIECIRGDKYKQKGPALLRLRFPILVINMRKSRRSGRGYRTLSLNVNQKP